MEEKVSIQYYIFKKKLLMIHFYSKKEFSYEEIANIVSSHEEIISAYCITLL